MTRNPALQPAFLVGHTGFVGSALTRQTRFDRCFNSSNIAGIEDSSCGTLVCAAAPGSMFEANNQPDADRAKVHALIDRLSKVRTERFILISSIAVLDDFAGGYDESTQAFQTELAYGRHRRELEAFVEDNFANHLIVRLPALFGHALRKNFLFDLLNPVPTMLTAEKFETLKAALDAPLAAAVEALYTLNPANGMHVLDRPALSGDARRPALEEAVNVLGLSATQFHNPATTYQYYGIDRLWADIGIALDAGLSHIHLVSEPVEAAVIHKRLTGEPMPETPARLHREDMRTAHAHLWDASGRYQSDAATTLAQLEAFFAAEKAPA